MTDPTFSLQECIRKQVEKESWLAWASQESIQDERIMKVQIITKPWTPTAKHVFKRALKVMHV